MPSYTPWTWSTPHQRHYSYLLADDGTTILDTLWSGHHHPAASNAAAPQPGPVVPVTVPAAAPANVPTSNSTSRWSQATSSQRADSMTTHSSPPHGHYGHDRRVSNANRRGEDEADDDDEDNETRRRIDSPNQPRTHSQQRRSNQNYPPAQTASFQPNAYATAPAQLTSTHATNQYSPSLPSNQAPRLTMDALPPDVLANMNYNDRRFIRTGPDRNDAESLDSRYRRVITPHHAHFFVPGRVFKMLWTEPAGQANPGRTRNSTHFSTVWCGEQAYSEIRRFVVVRNKGTFSQCIPVQTYKGRGATKPGLVMHDHGVIHTSLNAPNLMHGENLTKYSIRVEPSGKEVLEEQSRVNYGKAYAVEHNVKVLDIGMVVEGHRYLIETYFDSAMRGQ